MTLAMQSLMTDEEWEALEKEIDEELKLQKEVDSNEEEFIKEYR